MIKKYKKSLLSVIEMPLLVFFFGVSLIYLTIPYQPEDLSYEVSISSAIDTIYYDPGSRTTIMAENLNLPDSRQKDWSTIEAVLNSTFLNYELILSDATRTETIFSCTATSNKYYAERIISINENDNFAFRKLKLGVCY